MLTACCVQSLQQGSQPYAVQMAEIKEAIENRKGLAGREGEIGRRHLTRGIGVENWHNKT